MLNFVLWYYGLSIAAVLVIAVVSWRFFDKRRKKGQGSVVPPGFARTEEVSFDPIEGTRLRVYYNERTGERFYHEEKE